MQGFARIILAIACIVIAIAVYKYRHSITAPFQQDGTIEQVIVNILSYGVPALLALIGFTILLGGKPK